MLDKIGRVLFTVGIFTFGMMVVALLGAITTDVAMKVRERHFKPTKCQCFPTCDCPAGSCCKAK